MIDKILYVNENKVIIYYTHRDPVTVSSDSGKALELLDELLCPFNNAGATTLTGYKVLELASQEDTVIIELDHIA
jgi:hypothetical protein